MITVEGVKEKIQNEGQQIRQQNEEQLQTGTVTKRKSNIGLWMLIIGALTLGGYLFYINRKNSGNTGILNET